MTFSIVAFDKVTGAAGAATATGSVSVGAFVPYAKAGVGAITTQGAYTNWMYGERGMALLEQDISAENAVQKIIEPDEGREFRQCFIVDRHGTGAAWTGSENSFLKEFEIASGVVAGGNLLAESGVAEALIEAFLAHPDKPMAWRLLEALHAGEKAGGDARGLISAAIKVDFVTKPPVDLRVDYEPDRTLKKLEEVYQQYHGSPYKEFYDGVPTRDNYSKCGVE